jgi:hypothetical protein
MAKAKIPKKMNPVKDASTSNPLPVPEAPVPEATIKTAEASSAIPTNGNTKKTETKRAPRKPEIVRTEPRANLVPINLEDEIRSLAYLLSERRGFESGHETEDWLAAEHEVRQRYQQHSA